MTSLLGHCAGWGGIPEPCSAPFREKISFEEVRSAKKRALQRSVLCKGACSAKESALQRSVLCRGECCAEESALQRSVLCKEACSAKKRALQTTCSAKKRALQRRVLCKGERSAKKRAVQRRVLCKEACSAKKRALQRRVLRTRSHDQLWSPDLKSPDFRSPDPGAWARMPRPSSTAFVRKDTHCLPFQISGGSMCLLFQAHQCPGTVLLSAIPVERTAAASDELCSFEVLCLG